MNNERDELLNDLISYYGSPNEENSGDTTVIPAIKTEAVPAEETFGDTLVMNIKSQPVTAVTEETTVVDVPVASENEIPQDEVFGNLDLDGNIIQTHQPERTRRVIDTPAPRTRQRQTDAPPVRKTGLWYSLKPLWATLIVCVMLVFSYLFYVTDTGIVGIYKSNFSYNFSLLMRVFGIEYNPQTEVPIIGDANPFIITAHAEGEKPSYDTVSEKKASVPFSGADTASFEKYNNGVVCAKSNYLCFINKSGNKKWEHETQISNPIIAVAGKYIAVAGKDSTHLNLYKGEKLVYAVDISNKIKSCSVSEKGDVALVTDKAAYKGGVCVINKKGEEVFSWISGVNYITSAAMLKSRNVAVSLVSAENNVKSYVMLFDIYSTDPLNGTEIPDALIFDSVPYKNNAYVNADSSISSVNSDGELNYSVRFDNMDITHTASDVKGWRAVSYTEANLPYINIYNRRGSLYSATQTESVPDHIDLYKSTVLYNNGRDVICGEADDIKTCYSAPMTVQNLIMLNRNTYMIVYENSLEIIKL
ncbi:MAG: hypothetical protein IJC09_01695 [Clostridia bacterium]|nr:hypothetical protein [Clostridia bacterium]